jgi:hypothetical protein
MSTVFGEREVVEEAAGYWWLFFLAGIAWFVFSLLVFQWNYTTVYAVSFLFGVVAVIAGVNEFLQIAISTPGWKVVRGILGALFVLAGIWALVHPRNAFETVASLIGFFFLFKGIFDFTTAPLDASGLRSLVDPVRRRDPRDPARLLGRRQLPGAGDSARRLCRRDRAFAWDHRADHRLQAPGPPAAARNLT